MIITDFNISDVSFSKLPENKEIILVMHGSIFQYENDFLINCIFKENTTQEPKYYMALLPLKTIAAFPLGMIFKNQKLSSQNKITKTFEVSLNLEMKLQKVIKAKEIKTLKNHFLKIPNEINGYKTHYQLLEQNLFKFADTKSNMNVIFPHYEIARWFYMKSSSLTRQLLCSNLKGLYKDAMYIDDKDSKGIITLKYGSNNSDVSEIFRFVKDEYANIMFNRFSLDLSATKHESKKFKSMNLTSNFPVHGEIDFKIKGFHLNQNTIFVYQILEENSSYPFTELEAIREKSPNSNQTSTIAKINEAPRPRGYEVSS